MDYKHQEIEQKWQAKWREDKTYRVVEDQSKEKFYVLDMFPYPSGAGLHVGHPLGYIASDIYSRFKKLQGFNVLHPMGYDSFGLPAEQYAIQTGQHPAVTTEQNINRYREQLDKIGFAFDWEREIRTSDPKYYKWTQWIFKQLFNSWYDQKANKARPIESLIALFAEKGNTEVTACSCDDTPIITASEWTNFSETERENILSKYRLAYLADSWVNWCPELGTVLANDEVKDGVSERGGFPVEQKLMKQWNLRVTAYADRLLSGLDEIDFSESLKEQQRNWIGKSAGASVTFKVANRDESIEVFTTRPDTIFGVSFMVLAPEHELVDSITTTEFKDQVDEYKKLSANKSERERQANVKSVSGQFTGAYAVHPFTGGNVPIWIGDYVLAGYGTGAVMAVPAGDQRDYNFAKKFDLSIPNIFDGANLEEAANSDNSIPLTQSDFLNDLCGKEAVLKCIEEIEQKGIGRGKVNFRLRDAVFSRQRYWGEPFPIYYENGQPNLVADDKQVMLPKIDTYLPTPDGQPPLARASKQDWNIWEGDSMEFNTMPGWAGSSWYFLRYMDPNNDKQLVDKQIAEYWNQVDLYVGGAEHAVGHLLYSRFWTKFLFDIGQINFQEPFKKLINQGMILGNSAIAKCLGVKVKELTLICGTKISFDRERQVLVTKSMIDQDKLPSEQIDRMVDIRLPIDNLINEFDFDLVSFLKSARGNQFTDSVFLSETGYYLEGKLFDLNGTALNEPGKFQVFREVEKMSKRWFNVQTPDELCEKYGADTLRCYEMFLGPLEQSKPWNTKGINGVNNFLRKFWNLFHSDGQFMVSTKEATPEELKILHTAIKKVQDDLDRMSFNTVVSQLMIAVNELNEINNLSEEVLSKLVVLLSPYAPHLAEELWEALGNESSVTTAEWPKFIAANIEESSFEYPVSFNGKMRFKISLPTNMSKSEIETEVLSHEKSKHYLDGKTPKKVIVVPNRIVNVVA